jgi:hypothetical protein
MLMYARAAGVGLFMSLAACVLALGAAQSRGVFQRASENAGYPEFIHALGTESAWPYLRQDLKS